MNELVAEIVDQIEDIMVMPVLITGRSARVTFYEESNRIVLYIEGKEYLSIHMYRDKSHFDIVGVSDEAQSKMYSAGHKSVITRVQDVRWVYAILRRMMEK